MNPSSSSSVISCFLQFGRPFFNKKCLVFLILFSILALPVLKFAVTDQSFHSGTIQTIYSSENVTEYLQNILKGNENENQTLKVPLKNQTEVVIDSIGNAEENPIQNLPKNQTLNMMKIATALEEISHKLNYSQTGTELNRKSSRMQIFILTTWRSGSSFFGEAMSQHPEIFYHYEPIMFNTYQNLEPESGPDFPKALSLIKNLAECRYENADANEYMNYINDFGWFLLHRNPKIRDQCTKLGKSCYTSDFLNPACQLFSIQLLKLVRLRGKAGRQLLELETFKDFNTKIIYLVRDPRGIWASRLQVSWCAKNTSCGVIDNLCQSLNADLEEMKYIQAKYPFQVQVIRYEDVVFQPIQSFKNIFEKLGVKWSQEIEAYVKAHTKAQNSSQDPMSTFKFSQERAQIWQTELKWMDVKELQKKCGDYMIQLGYPFIESGNFNTNKIEQHF